MEFANDILYDYDYIADKPGIFVDLHCHNRFELLYLINGDMQHVVEDRKYLIKGGDLVLVRPSTYHYLEKLSEQPYERYNILFTPERIGIDISLIPEDMEVISLLNNPIAHELFKKLEYYYQHLETEAFSKILENTLYELFLNLHVFSDTKHREKILLSPILTKALTYINENLFTIIDIDEVAQALYISPSYLFYMFRVSLHQTPKKYITEKRLLATQRKIFDGNKPTEIYKECGFHDYTTFFRCYTAYFGHTPSEDIKKSTRFRNNI